MPEYIERENVKEALLGWDYDPSDDDVECAINHIPAADVAEVKHGYWKEPKGGGYQCSNCRAFFDEYYGFNAKERCIYCPSCGAKMDQKEGAE